MTEVVYESYHPRLPPECFFQGRPVIQALADLGSLTHAGKAHERVFGYELKISTNPIQKQLY